MCLTVMRKLAIIAGFSPCICHSQCLLSSLEVLYGHCFDFGLTLYPIVVIAGICAINYNAATVMLGLLCVAWPLSGKQSMNIP